MQPIGVEYRPSGHYIIFGHQDHFTCLRLRIRLSLHFESTLNKVYENLFFGFRDFANIFDCEFLPSSYTFEYALLHILKEFSRVSAFSHISLLLQQKFQFLPSRYKTFDAVVV